MIVRTRSVILLVATIAGLGSEAFAVDFGVHNQTNLKFRMRVQDRGQFPEWAEMRPGFKDATARSVERADHAVEIDIWTTAEGKTQPDWVAFYRGTHASRAFTRKLHLFEYRDMNGKPAIFMTWHDEPPGCRDWPLFENGQFKNGCLLRSGWTDDIFQRAAQIVGNTALRVIIAGS